MKIVICSSVSFAEKVMDAKEHLERQGIHVIIPQGLEDYLNDAALKERASGWGTLEGAERKMKNNLIKSYYDEIASSDAILVINQDKVGIHNYLGGNSFLEMGFAHVLGKPIYLLNPIPTELKVFYQEMVAMQPTILDGDLNKIPLS
jgi:nucleoside 2-deoxyribosyltransferase